MSPGGASAISIFKVPRTEPFKDIPISFALFPDNKNLHLEMMEERKKVRPDAPPTITIRRSAMTQPSEPAREKGPGQDLHSPPPNQETAPKSKKSKDRSKDRSKDQSKDHKHKSKKVDKDIAELRKQLHKSVKVSKSKKSESTSLSDSERKKMLDPHESTAGSDDSTDSKDAKSSASDEEGSSTPLVIGADQASESSGQGSESSASGSASSDSGSSSGTSKSSTSSSSSQSRSRTEKKEKVLAAPAPTLSPEMEKQGYLRKLSMWRRSYPTKPIPEFNEFSDLVIIRQYVKDFEHSLQLDNSIKIYSTGLSWGFVGMEKFMVNTLNMDGMRGYAQDQQSKMDELYHPYIVEIAEQSSMVIWFQGLSPDMKLVITMLFQAVLFYMTGGSSRASGFSSSNNASAAPSGPPPARRMQGPSIHVDQL